MRKFTTICTNTIIGALCCVNAIASDNTPIEKKLSFDDVILPYTDSGSGNTVVAVHGAVSDKRVWDAYQQPLSQSNRFITYTRRFYGTAAWPEGENVYDASVHAEDLAALIRSIDAAPVHLITRSSGAYTAVIAAVKYPELISSLVMWEPFVGNDFAPSAGFDDKTLERIVNWRKGFAAAAIAVKANDLSTAVENFIEHVYELEDDGFATLPPPLQHMLYDNARTLSLLFNGKPSDQVTCEFLGKIDAPTLVLRGGKTHADYAITHTRAAECIPGSELVVIDDVTHDGAGKKPGEISTLALDFWSALDK